MPCPTSFSSRPTSSRRSLGQPAMPPPHRDQPGHPRASARSTSREGHGPFPSTRRPAPCCHPACDTTGRSRDPRGTRGSRRTRPRCPRSPACTRRSMYCCSNAR
jgi:hypothetical protein